MQQSEEMQVFIGLAADNMSFFCTVTDRRGGSTCEELVEMRTSCDPLLATEDTVSEPGTSALATETCSNEPWLQIGCELAKTSPASAAAAVSNLFAAHR